MNQFSIYLMFIIFIKFLYMCLSIAHIYYNAKDEADSDTDTRITFWKERMEFIFVALMSFLLIYIFNPRTNRTANLDFETKTLLFILGFILLTSANWKTFFNETPLVKRIRKINKNRNK